MPVTSPPPPPATAGSPPAHRDPSVIGVDETVLPPPPPRRPNDLPGRDGPKGFVPRELGVLWVGAAGVAMLLAAAAVLTAIRWDDIGQSAKLAGLVAITGALLALGRRLRSVVPQTASAIHHLGALLIPFDMAAVAVLAGRPWEQTLLLTSLTAVLAWTVIERAVPSVVLRWATLAAVAFAAAGVAAVTPLSTPLVVAGCAVAAALVHGRVAATVWSLAAGLLPLAAVVEWPTRIIEATGTLGFDAGHRWQLIAAGLVASTVAIELARREPRIERAWVALGLPVVTTVVASAIFTSDAVGWICAGALFLLVEIIALVTRGDRGWGEILATLQPIAEVAGFALGIAAFAEAMGRSSLDPTYGSGIFVANVLFAFGWLTADRARVLEPVDGLVGAVYGSDWGPTTAMFPLAAMGAVIAIGSPTWVLVAAAWALAAQALLTRRTGAELVALVAAAVLVVLAGPGAWGLLAIALAVGLLVASARLVVHSPVSPEGRGRDLAASLLVAAACIVAAFGVEPLGDLVDRAWALPGAVVMSWLVAWSVGWPRPAAFDAPASVARLFAVASLIGVWFVAAPFALAAVAFAVAAMTVDWLSNRNPFWLVVAGAVAAIALVPAGLLIGWSFPAIGLAMAVLSVVFVGLATAAPSEWEAPFLGLAGSSAVLGIAHSALDTQRLALSLGCVGLGLLIASAARRSAPLAGLGAVTAVLGYWLELAYLDVTWIEAYLAPAAVIALAVGWRAHHQNPTLSTWASLAPPAAVLGGVAVLDRLDGASAWHAVIAGGVGVLAVIGGATLRAVGPLLVGTALLTVTVGYELVGPAALVPTWGLLAIGGTVLLGAALAIERSAINPVDAGRRVIDVLQNEWR